MSEEYILLVGKIACALIIKKYRAYFIFSSVGSMVEVILIIRSLNDRIIYIRIRNVYPADKVLALIGKYVYTLENLNISDAARYCCLERAALPAFVLYISAQSQQVPQLSRILPILTFFHRLVCLSPPDRQEET